jgi:3-deoxy-D-manno-octulosonic-acid transferase
MTPLDIAYLTALGFASPWILARPRSRYAFWTKFTGHVGSPQRKQGNPRVWFHGVSVGEIHLLRTIVTAFQQRRPDCDVVVSSTTETGLAEARKTFAELPVATWPFDFSWAVRRAIATIRPDLIVLGESELWPGMLAAANAAGVPVVVINGRFSPKSTRNYRRVAPLARTMLNRVAMFGMQTQKYADNLASLGVPRSRITVTGSAKFDGVETDRNNPKTQELRKLFGIHPNEIVWVAGSTQAPEEQGCIEIYKRLRESTPNLRLIIVPRQKDAFDSVAQQLLQSGVPFLRRSALHFSPPWKGGAGEGFSSAVPSPLNPSPTPPFQGGDKRKPVILLDTIGELRAAWGLADIAFVGGSLDGQRGGQNMIEPAAYGCAVIFGPHVWNFKAVVEQFLAADAARLVCDFHELESAIQNCLSAEVRHLRGKMAQRLVLSQQGATTRTLELIDAYLPTCNGRKAG